MLADTFERVIKARRPFDPRRASEKTWLYSIALNCLRDGGRRRAAEQRALELIGAGERTRDGSGGVAVLESRDMVTRLLPCLSEVEREAIALRYGAELTVPEIAKLTGEPLTKVHGRVHRALRKLREELDVA